MSQIKLYKILYLLELYYRFKSIFYKKKIYNINDYS